jgi:hypothetical protein
MTMGSQNSNPAAISLDQPFEREPWRPRDDIRHGFEIIHLAKGQFIHAGFRRVRLGGEL